MKIQNLIILILTVFIYVNCSNDNNSYNEDEIVINLNASNYNESSLRIFLLVEDNHSNSIFTDINLGTNNIINRGEEITGEKLNLHFITINSFDYWNIDSYYNIELGKEIDLSKYLASNTPIASIKSSTANISFTEIPEFDIATRTAKHSNHAHTLGSLDVPCASIGGNQLNSGDKFYVCLQSEQKSGYKLLVVPEVDEFIIPLNNLNTNLTKYSVLKNTETSLSININALTENETINIFNLNSSDESLFKSENIDIYIPNDLAEINNFSTHFGTQQDNYSRSYYYFDDKITTEYSFINAIQKVSHIPGQTPVVTTTNNKYDLLSIYLTDKENLNTWNIYTFEGDKISLPKISNEIQNQISENFSFNEFLSNIGYINTTAIEDSRIQTYNEVIDTELMIINIEADRYTKTTESVSLKK